MKNNNDPAILRPHEFKINIIRINIHINSEVPQAFIKNRLRFGRVLKSLRCKKFADTFGEE